VSYLGNARLADFFQDSTKGLDITGPGGIPPKKSLLREQAFFY
jgi:hypothetical protein